MGLVVDTSPLMSDFLQKSGGIAIIDGGLATELERHGADLNDPLWSAKCLLTSPHLIRSVHLDYLEAGADIIITASYQATIQGFQSKGFSIEESEGMLKRSVEIACEARDIYNDRCRESSCEYADDGRIFKERSILIAASVGSYGAYLADGSEYSGDYGDKMNVEFLKDFHRRRVQILAEAGSDLIAFETVPTQALSRCIAHATGKDREKLVTEISANGFHLAQDPFGNYVIQFIIEQKIPSGVATLLSQFEGNYVNLSMQKFSSHVVEKCLKHLE